ncbi:MAG TPA: hypothetical protein VFY40_10295 [Blastocatellia bacterium]|nr:hypothetical protein [Blastocatellia bacterium]
MLTALLGVALTFFFIKESQKKRELRLILPRRFDIFSSSYADDRLAEVNLHKLRTVLLPDGDFEVRLWIGFGLNGDDCLILRYFSGQWSALHLQGMAEAPPFPNTLAPLPPPKSGWNKTWQKLIDAGILRLPDADEVKCNPRVLDGISFVVESNINMIYRSYAYPNPWYDNPPFYKRCNEAEQMILIGWTIGEEFGLEQFDLSEAQVK